MRWPDALENGACVGLPPQLFDADSVNDLHAALTVCRACTVRRQCLEWVKPSRRFFDGVCGGKLWRDGKQMDPAEYVPRRRGGATIDNTTDNAMSGER